MDNVTRSTVGNSIDQPMPFTAENVERVAAHLRNRARSSVVQPSEQLLTETVEDKAASDLEEAVIRFAKDYAANQTDEAGGPSRWLLRWAWRGYKGAMK